MPNRPDQTIIGENGLEVIDFGTWKRILRNGSAIDQALYFIVIDEKKTSRDLQQKYIRKQLCSFWGAAI